MESQEIPDTVSYQDLLKALNERPLGINDDQYRSVYIIQLIQRLLAQNLIHGEGSSYQNYLTSRNLPSFSALLPKERDTFLGLVGVGFTNETNTKSQFRHITLHNDSIHLVNRESLSKVKRLDDSGLASG